MLRATSVVPAVAVKPAHIVDTVVLDYAGRHRRRVVLTGERGTEFLLDLERATVLRGGDGLRLESGGLVLVQAAAEHLIEIRSPDPLRLLRLAWHIGNRHVAAEITHEAIYIVADSVIEQMVRGLGGAVARVTRPFAPEGGAYAAHGHASHGHDAPYDEGNPE